MDGSADARRADIDVHDDTLWLVRPPRIAIGHGKCHHFIRTCYYAGEGVGVVLLALKDSLEDAGVIRPKVDEAVLDARLKRRISNFNSRLKSSHVQRDLTSIRASKNAEDAVYLLHHCSAWRDYPRPSDTLLHCDALSEFCRNCYQL